MTWGIVAPGQITDQLDDIVAEVLGAEIRAAPQRPRCSQVSAGSTSEPKIDASRVECLKGAELFGDHERCVIGKHDSAGPDPDGGSGGGKVGDQHGRRGACDCRHPVVLGHPEALVTESLGH